MPKKSILNSPKLTEARRKKRKIFKRKIIIFIIILCLIFVALSALAQIKRININNVEVVGNNIIDKEAIASIAQTKLAGKFLFFLPKTNFLLYPKNAIIHELADQHKRLKNIESKLIGTQTLQISVMERTGEYTWCGEVLPEPGIGLEDVKCYFMDKDGYIFDQAPFFSGDVYLKFFGPLNYTTDKSSQDEEMSSSAESPAGNYFIQDTFIDITKFEDNLVAIGLRPIALFVKNDQEMEMYLDSSKSIRESPKILFRKDSNFVKLAENIDTALSADPLKTDFKKKYSSLEYIDLRFGNKVYYRFK